MWQGGLGRLHLGFKCYVNSCKLLAFSEYLILFPIPQIESSTALYVSGYSQCITPTPSPSRCAYSFAPSASFPSPSFYPTCSLLPFPGQHFPSPEMTVLLSNMFSNSDILSFPDLNLSGILIRAQCYLLSSLPSYQMTKVGPVIPNYLRNPTLHDLPHSFQGESPHFFVFILMQICWSSLVHYFSFPICKMEEGIKSRRQFSVHFLKYIPCGYLPHLCMYVHTRGGNSGTNLLNREVTDPFKN